jgi:hypothetical protein
MSALAAMCLFALRREVRSFASAPLSSVENRILAAQPGRTLTFAVGDDVRVFDVSREGVAGVGIALRAFPGELRGHLGSESIELRLATPRITGLLGDHAVSLDMLPASEGTRVAGHFGQRKVALSIRMAGIDGDVGPCHYQLKLNRGSYTGQIGCGGEPEDVRLEVPVGFVAKSDAEVTATLIAVLAR